MQSVRLERKLWAVLFLHYWVKIAVSCLFLWGIAVLGSRLLQTRLAFDPLWLLLIPISLVAAYLLSKRRLPERLQLESWMDRENHLGGLLAASPEADASAWRFRLEGIPAPTVRWRTAQPLILALSAVLFVLAALELPLSALPPESRLSLDISGQRQVLEEKIQILEEEEILEPEQKETFQAQLRELEQEADGSDPFHALEAMDHLQQNLKQLASEATQQTVPKMQSLGEAQGLAELLQQSPSAPAELEKQLRRRLSQLRREKQLPTASTVSTSLSKEKYADLSQQLKALEERFLERSERLFDAKLIDAKLVGECRLAGQNGRESLKALIGTTGDDGKSRQALMAAISRGEGPANLSFSDSRAGSYSFDSVPIEPNQLVTQGEMELVGMSAARPETENSSTAHQTVLGAEAGADGSALTRPLLPRHRQTVKRYFSGQPKTLSSGETTTQ